MKLFKPLSIPNADMRTLPNQKNKTIFKKSNKTKQQKLWYICTVNHVEV